MDTQLGLGLLRVQILAVLVLAGGPELFGHAVRYRNGTIFSSAVLYILYTVLSTVQYIQYQHYLIHIFIDGMRIRNFQQRSMVVIFQRGVASNIQVLL